MTFRMPETGGSYEHAVSSLGDSCHHLAFDPFIGLVHAVFQANRRLPAEILEDLRVVAVATIHALGSVELILPFQRYARNLFHHIYNLIDGDEFTAAKIDRLMNVALENGLCAFRAVIDVHEAACLLAVAPDLDFVFT